MKIPDDPNDMQRRFAAQQAGNRGRGFAETRELPPEVKEVAPTLPLVIPSAKLKHGAYYLGTCRNASVARWNANDRKFYYWRTKFGRTFIETICHCEDDNIFDVFDPLEEIPKPEKDIPFAEPE